MDASHQAELNEFVETVRERNENRDVTVTTPKHHVIHRDATQSAMLYLLRFVKTHGYNEKSGRVEKN